MQSLSRGRVNIWSEADDTFGKDGHANHPSVQAQNKERTQQTISGLTLPFKWDLLRNKNAIFICSRFASQHAGPDWASLLKK